VFQYIGELCRYLTHSAPHPHERAHRLRLCCGNGLRADVWNEFEHRFGIPRILEFYAATEGNVTMFNFEGKPGAIGRIPAFLAHRSPTALVKFRVDAGELIRGDGGFCIRCKANETGEAIGKIIDGGAGFGSRFEGYSSGAESEKKILRDVFERGDAWFRTGDLMRKDEQGFFYFVDRIGDTFRWKGENVATSEVGEVIAAFPGIADVSVYGVAVSGMEGRAGMASIVSPGAIDLRALHDHLAKSLPDYARPVFLRLSREIEVTATFKHLKADLARRGFDPAATNDPIYYRDPGQRAFVRLDQAAYERIVNGHVRL
jgi:fatty-acyl-CoA synthase